MKVSEIKHIQNILIINPGAAEDFPCGKPGSGQRNMPLKFLTRKT